MWKLILIVSLLPTLAAVLLRKWCCDRVVKSLRHGVTNQTGMALAAHLLRHLKLASEIEIRQKKKTRLAQGPPQRIHLSLASWNAKDVVGLGEVSHLVGRALIARENEELVAWREWAVRFGWAFPVFTLVVVVFAIAVAKLTVMMGIVVVVGALGLASVFLLATTMVEIEAARRVACLIEESRALPRQADGDEVARCCRAMAWSRVVPGGIEWALGGRLKGGRNSLEAKSE